MAGSKHIAIVGAGLVGSLLSIYLSKRGYQVSVFERRSDMRKHGSDSGRSINLALSNRGIRALEEVGALDILRQIAIPMHGRMMHAPDGKLSFLPYGKEGQFINSISRGELTLSLIKAAESQGANFYFDQRVKQVDLVNTQLTVEHNATTTSKNFDGIVGADGAFSVVRMAMQVTDRFDFSQDYIDHGYKELHIPADHLKAFKIEKNALHIWPRESFMMIASSESRRELYLHIIFSF